MSDGTELTLDILESEFHSFDEFLFGLDFPDFQKVILLINFDELEFLADLKNFGEAVIDRFLNLEMFFIELLLSQHKGSKLLHLALQVMRIFIELVIRGIHSQNYDQFIERLRV